ncbi:uncharacterized protein METZ01_LOCUS480731, partial [marine metagenome]
RDLRRAVRPGGRPRRTRQPLRQTRGTGGAPPDGRTHDALVWYDADAASL